MKRKRDSLPVDTRHSKRNVLLLLIIFNVYIAQINIKEDMINAIAVLERCHYGGVNTKEDVLTVCCEK